MHRIWSPKLELDDSPEVQGSQLPRVGGVGAGGVLTMGKERWEEEEHEFLNSLPPRATVIITFNM